LFSMPKHLFPRTDPTKADPQTPFPETRDDKIDPLSGASSAAVSGASGSRGDPFLIDYDDTNNALSSSTAVLDLSVLDSKEWINDEIISAFFTVLENEYAVKWLGPFALQQRVTNSFVRKNPIVLAIHSLIALHVVMSLLSLVIDSLFLPLLGSKINEHLFCHPACQCQPLYLGNGGSQLLPILRTGSLRGGGSATESTCQLLILPSCRCLPATSCGLTNNPFLCTL